MPDRVSLPEPECHYAFWNCGILCFNCGTVMDGSDSEHNVRPFRFIVKCINPTCDYVGIPYFLAPEQGVRLERIAAREGART